MEGHRGTLTSQAWLKRANRLLETKLHNLEAMAVLRGKKLDMEALWIPLLTLQFHDILCGTAIQAVFEEARKTCAALEAQIDALWDDLLPKETTEKAASLINLSPMQACRLSLYRRIRSTIPWFRTVADPALRSVAFSLMKWPILCRSRRSIACASRAVNPMSWK